jgi:hypothetical protein
MEFDPAPGIKSMTRPYTFDGTATRRPMAAATLRPNNQKEKNMKFRFSLRYLALVAVAGTAACTTMTAKSPMSFFVTSTGPGQGANLGGLEGADRYCQSMADKAGATQRRWHAYLSTTAVGAVPAVNARDRIGAGPWRNAKGDVIATSVDNLHGDNNLTKQTALSEIGTIIKGRGDSPTQHDILTGSAADGRATAFTCNNWTSSGDGKAIVGHSDRDGTASDPVLAKSWNASHETLNCSQPGLVTTGGAGLLYCFAVD